MATINGNAIGIKVTTVVSTLIECNVNALWTGDANLRF